MTVANRLARAFLAAVLAVGLLPVLPAALVQDQARMAWADDDVYNIAVVERDDGVAFGVTASISYTNDAVYGASKQGAPGASVYVACWNLPAGYVVQGYEYSADGGQTWQACAYKTVWKQVQVYTFAMPEADVIVRSDYLSPVNLGVAEAENGSISLSATSGKAGDTVNVSVAPDDGYRIRSLWYESGGERTDLSAASFPIPSADAVVHAEFVPEGQVDQTIDSADDLRALATRVNGGDSCYGMMFALSGDIDLAGAEWTPIGTAESPFRGSLDGRGHQVTGLNVSAGSTFAGLFGRAQSSVFKGVAVAGTVDSDCLYVAGVCAYGEYCAFDGCVSGVDVANSGNSGYAGGISASAYFCTFASCENHGSVSSAQKGHSAGIVAIASAPAGEAVADRCLNSGTVSGCYAGGIVCKFNYTSSAAKVSACVNTGDIASGPIYGGVAAGIVAYAQDGTRIDISDCRTSGTISVNSDATKQNGEPSVAGVFAGKVLTTASSMYSGGIKNCYSTATLVKGGSYTQTDALYGAITPAYVRVGNDFAGFNAVATLIEVSNCYGATEIAALEDAAATLNAGRTGADAPWVADTAGVNPGSTPLLSWESGEVDTSEYTLSFAASGMAEGVAASVEVRDADGEAVAAQPDGTYLVRSGTYSYAVSAPGYVPASGEVAVRGRDARVEVALAVAATVTLTGLPEGARAGVTCDGVAYPAAADGTCAVPAGRRCWWSVECEGCLPASGSFVASEGLAVAVAMTPLSAVDGTVTGGSVVAQGGTYYVEPGSTGAVTLAEDVEATFVGAGIGAPYSGLQFLLSEGDACTLRDMALTSGSAPAVEMVAGASAALLVEGTVLMEYDCDTGAGYTSSTAMVHVPQGCSLEVGGAGTLYLYKSSGGAGIGGNYGELNGEIAFRMSGQVLAKGTKQGALVGSGTDSASAEGVPGEISFESGSYSLVGNSRGAVVGGAAGSSGASAGTVVRISGTACVGINVDYSGAAIGGGGYSAGNDASGGTLVVEGGSLRTYIDANAVFPNGGDDPGSSLWPVTEAGVSGSCVTALKVDGDGEPVYLLALDTALLDEQPSDGTHSVSVDGKAFYSGGLHRYGFANESLSKAEQATLASTLDNWYENGETRLFLYVTGGDHEVVLDGVRLLAAWDAEAGTFSVSEAPSMPEGATLGDVNNSGKVNIVDAQVAYDLGAGKYADEALARLLARWAEGTTPAQVLCVADANADAAVDAADAFAIQYAVHHGGAFGPAAG